MTEVAFMTRGDWANQGRDMSVNGALIREWIGTDRPHLLTVPKPEKFSRDDHSADFETATFVSSAALRRGPYAITDLSRLSRDDQSTGAIIAIHPHENKEIDVLARVVREERARRLFVMVWSPGDLVLDWLGGIGASNLHPTRGLPSTNPIMIAGASVMVSKEYNGLSSGRGKDAVINTIRVVTASGVPRDKREWLRAYFAASGSARHAETVGKYLAEMDRGITHRVTQKPGAGLLEYLQERAAETGSSSIR